MTLFEIILLGVVEGLTEFLPISSTGHMVIVQHLLGMESTEYLRAFTVMIQFGAILSVVLLYYKQFFGFIAPAKDLAIRASWLQIFDRFRFYFLLLVGILPAVVLGLLFNDWVDRVLGEVWIIAINLLIGGLFMLFIDKWLKQRGGQEVTYAKSFAMGLFQCVAIFFPGMSRSMSTIVGGMAIGLNRKVAAEFSFFLAVPTMFGASCLQVIKLWRGGHMALLEDNLGDLLLGNLVAFLVAFFAVRYFIRFIQRHTFRFFGVYRIILGGVILVALLCGAEMRLL